MGQSPGTYTSQRNFSPTLRQHASNFQQQAHPNLQYQGPIFANNQHQGQFPKRTPSKGSGFLAYQPHLQDGTPILPNTPEYEAAAKGNNLKPLDQVGHPDLPLDLPREYVTHLGRYRPNNIPDAVPLKLMVFEIKGGKALLSSAIIIWYSGKCPYCSGPHPRGHPNQCPYWQIGLQPPTWDLCTICRLGFHPRCLLDIVHVRQKYPEFPLNKIPAPAAAQASN